MLKVVSFKICPFVQRVTALLEAKKLPYEIEYISLKDKPQWFLEISPNGQVPLLITESGTALFESDAIVEYLDEISPPIETDVTPEQRAIDRAWSYMATKNYLVQCSTMRSSDGVTLQERENKLKKIFAKAEAALTTSTYFKCESLSNVDIAWLPLLHRSSIICRRSGYDMLEGYPKVQAWRKATMNSGIVAGSVAEDFEEAFSGFYLSTETYLGAQAESSALLKCVAENQCANCC